MKKICKNIVNYFKRMYNNLQQFGPPGAQGPDMNMTGKWTKLHPQYPGPSTLFVRDSIMDGNDMIVVTDQGNMSMSDFANNYYKESDEEYNIDGSVRATSTPPSISTPPPIKTDIDYDILTAGMGENPNVEPEIPVVQQYVPTDTVVENKPSTVSIELKNNTNDAIDKVFSKLESSPRVDVSLYWDQFPKNEMQMLIKYFDVSMDDIATYIVQNFITKEIINDAVKTKLNEYIS